MKFIKEVDVVDFHAWSRAIDTLDIIIDNNKCKELEQLLEDIFCDKLPTETELNEFLWFDSDYIFECLDIKIEE